jgi:N utilization substance protein B
MTRRALREHLVRLLYMREFHEADELEEQYQLYFDVILPNEDAECEERDEVLTRLVAIVEKLPEIDALLTAKLQNWNFRRIGLTEKTILRISAFEILYDDVPAKVAINEAVELAKLYGGEQSSGFVNGVLAKIVKGLEPDDGNQST